MMNLNPRQISLKQMFLIQTWFALWFGLGRLLYSFLPIFWLTSLLSLEIMLGVSMTILAIRDLCKKDDDECI